MTQTFYYVWNVTDKILATPDKMTKGAADQFIKDFPKRYYAQGYYKTSTGHMMDPDNVILAAIPESEIDKTVDDDFSDIRNRDEPDEYNGPDESNSWHWSTYMRKRDL